ncbi:MAG: helix-turn-helix domain-containing protein [Verrucomicrobiales bacterium]|nr:helix-turn-helix domain-containing protein [Verrucomicrobiota bacterium JB025]
MEQLFEGLEDVMFSLKDRQDRYLSANKAFLLRVGIPKRSGIIGLRTKEVFPGTLARQFEEQDAEILRGKNSIYNRLDVVTNPDGSLGWYITDKVPVRDHHRRVVAVASTTRDLKRPADQNSEMAEIVKFVITMQRQFSEPIRIAALASECGMTQSKLERRMRSLMSLSPRQLLTRIRVEAAAEMLVTTNQRISDIAYECGFCDQPTFCRQFKNLTGTTAGEYRRTSRIHEGVSA